MFTLSHDEIYYLYDNGTEHLISHSRTYSFSKCMLLKLTFIVNNMLTIITRVGLILHAIFAFSFVVGFYGFDIHSSIRLWILLIA